MERKIGEKFEYEPGVWFVVTPEVVDCSGCAFIFPECSNRRGFLGYCNKHAREDGRDIIFRKYIPDDRIDKTAELEARILRLEQMLSLEPVIVEQESIKKFPRDQYSISEAWSRARREAIDENFKKSIDKLSE